MKANNPCQLLTWDTGFFGFRIAQVTGNRLTPQLISRILSWCDINEINCLYFLADSDDVQTVILAENNDYKFTDIRLTMDYSFINTYQENGDVVVRIWKSEDLLELQQIAKKSFKLSRFYYDNCFPSILCDQLYETWIRKSCKGFADHVLVAEKNNKPVGFITGNFNDASRSAEIGLLGVAKEYYGQRIGFSLVNNMLDLFLKQGAEQVLVVTQGRNIASQRLYQRCGFRTKAIQLWYHKWF